MNVHFYDPDDMFRVEGWDEPMDDEYTPDVAECLQYLEEAGWSDLIDEQWSSDVQKVLTDKFPGIERDVLLDVLRVVLI